MGDYGMLDKLVDLVAYPLMCGLLLVSLVGWAILLGRLKGYRHQKKLQQAGMGSSEQESLFFHILTKRNARFDVFIKLIMWVSLLIGIYLIIRVFGFTLTVATFVFFVCMYKAKDKTKYILALKVMLGLAVAMAVGLYLFFLGIDWPVH